MYSTLDDITTVQHQKMTSIIPFLVVSGKLFQDDGQTGCRGAFHEHGRTRALQLLSNAAALL